MMNVKEFARKAAKPAAIIGGSVAGVVIICLIIWQAHRLFSPRVIKGIDVSHFQGDISWRAVKDNGQVKFVYLKATEGETFRDPQFSQNWNGAFHNGIAAGAYHFYSATSSGASQAQNFIATVPKKKGELPPAIDIEGGVTKQANFKTELADYVNAITKYYGEKPVFYVPDKVYNMLYDQYHGYRFWIIDLDSTHKSPSVKVYTLWQYSNKGSIAGIDGKVDLDEYKGSLWNFDKLLRK